MPETFPYRYLFTITFQSMTSNQKFAKIRRLHKFFMCRLRQDFTYGWAIEYHLRGKYKGCKHFDSKDHLLLAQNTSAPHVHGYIAIKKPLDRIELRHLITDLREYYGNTQFYIQQDQEEIDAWDDYCRKYVDWNNSLYDFEHYTENTIIYEPPIDPFRLSVQEYQDFIGEE